MHFPVFVLYSANKGGGLMTKKRTSYALLVIDMLNDFVRQDAPLRVPAVGDVIPQVIRRVDNARIHGVPVIFLCDAHDPDDREFEGWPPHAVEGTPGARVIDDLAPQCDDIVIRKKRFSGFFRTDLDATLQKLGTTHLFVTGLVTNICVLYTVADARSRGYQVTVYRDSVAGLDPETHDFALRQMKEILGAEVV